MSLPLILACVWLAAANLIAMFPSRHHHWPAAYVLMTIGAPLIVWIAVVDGALFAGLALALGAWLLRWPVRYLLRWLRAQVVGDSL